MLHEAKSEGLPITRRNLPALPRVLFGRDSRRRYDLQMRTADSNSRESGALWKGLEHGVIDLIATDHSP